MSMTISQYSPAGEKEYVRYFTTNDAILYSHLRNLEKENTTYVGPYAMLDKISGPLKSKREPRVLQCSKKYVKVTKMYICPWRSFFTVIKYTTILFSQVK